MPIKLLLIADPRNDNDSNIGQEHAREERADAMMLELAGLKSSQQDLQSAVEHSIEGISQLAVLLQMAERSEKPLHLLRLAEAGAKHAEALAMMLECAIDRSR